MTTNKDILIVQAEENYNADGANARVFYATPEHLALAARNELASSGLFVPVLHDSKNKSHILRNSSCAVRRMCEYRDVTNPNIMTNEIQNIIAEIKTLTARNAEITKAGGFFTQEQIDNEKKAWKMKMTLRFDHGMEIGTY